MKAKEAIEVLTDKHTSIGTTKCDDVAWRKLQPAIDAAVEALEKQIPKKPVQGEPYNWIDSVRVGRRYKNVKKTSYSHACPNCGDTVVQLRNKYCSKCGQAIDWSENNGE